MELATSPGQEISSGILTACLLAGRLRDWELAVALTRQAMSLWRWGVALLQSGPRLALCARALAEKRPEVARVLRGAAYAAFGHARPRPMARRKRVPRRPPPATISFSARYARPANWWRPRWAMTSKARSAPQVRR
ncbi:hypothetical protein [Mycobacterium sp. URHB0021]|jgi:hypothetical protein